MNYLLEQQKLFSKYFMKYGDFKVAQHSTPEDRWNHTTYKQLKDDFPNDDVEHRMIFDDEIVLDVDEKSIIKSMNTYTKIKKGLIKDKITFSVWNTGNALGYHFHVVYPELMVLDERKRGLAKRLLTNKLTYGSKVDNQLCGKHLIRAEYGYYEKTHPLKKYKVMIDNKVFGVNKMSKQMCNKINEVKFIKRSDIKFNTNYPCNKFFLEETLKDGRKRALFVICSILRQQGKSDDEVFSFLKNYADVNSIKIRDFTLRSMVHKPLERFVGCTYQKNLLEEIGMSKICDGCSLSKRYEK